MHPLKLPENVRRMEGLIELGKPVAKEIAGDETLSTEVRSAAFKLADALYEMQKQILMGQIMELQETRPLNGQG